MKKETKRQFNFRHIALLILTAVFLILSTYAWFTSNTLVQVESLEIYVQASEGFQISLDAINWKSIIQASEITGNLVNQTYDVNQTYSGNNNHVPAEMKPVSSGLTTNSSSGYMNMFLGTVTTDDVYGSPTRGQYILSASEMTEAAGSGASGGYFIAFDLFFKTNFNIELHLDQTADAVDNAAAGSSSQDKGMENSARVAFVKQGYIPSTDTRTGTALATAAQALKYTEYQDGRNITVWEPNYDDHTDATKLETLNMLGIATNSTIWNTRIDYDGIRAIIDESTPVLLTQANVAGDAVRSTNYFKNVSSSQVVATAKGTPRADTVDTGIVLEAGITKFRIYMWLEGQDYDCRR